jgi:hypothetical protein
MMQCSVEPSMTQWLDRADYGSAGPGAPMISLSFCRLARGDHRAADKGRVRTVALEPGSGPHIRAFRRDIDVIGQVSGPV